MKTTVKMALAAATLLSSASVISTAYASEEENGKCHGVNSCKGKTACATAEGACSGTNSCKGKGWLPMDKKACEEKEGKFEPFQKS